MRQQTQAYVNIYQRTQELFDSSRTQCEVRTASRRSLLNEQLTLLSQNRSCGTAKPRPLRAALDRSKTGGCQWDQSREAAAAFTSTNQHTGISPKESLAAQ